MTFALPSPLQNRGFTCYLPVGSLQGNDRNDSADYSSMKKSIWVPLTRWSPALNELIDLTVTTSEGRRFHLLITRSEKKCLRMLWAEWCFSSFKLWPRVRVSKLKSKNFEAGTEDWPVMILSSSTRSARLRRSSSDHKPSSLRRSLSSELLEQMSEPVVRRFISVSQTGTGRVHDTRRNDWRRQDNESTIFRERSGRH